MSLGRTVDCEMCDEPFPEELLGPFVTMCQDCGLIRTFSVCGVCALEASRIIHGDQSYEFEEGSKAREMYDECLMYNERRSCNVSIETEERPKNRNRT